MCKKTPAKEWGKQETEGTEVSRWNFLSEVPDSAGIFRELWSIKYSSDFVPPSSKKAEFSYSSNSQSR